eukprot:TRINITY_DN22747_c0_g1_i1.p1 TRINITY_DN22747_c0_g1~~TRINITY_DN22747_c0_g1_i1.p1  ORF type:complete len:198 (-),score=37.79 TRINITY_DN22747_c0_g1_i1:19-612(-)
MTRLALLLFFCCSCSDFWAAAHYYAKPPCGADEVQASLRDRTLCTVSCKEDAGGVASSSDGLIEGCPSDKPKDAFAKPKCLLAPAPKGDRSHPDQRKRYCGLACKGNSYCPAGSKCTLVNATSEQDEYGDMNPLGMNYPHLVTPDDLVGVCTYRAKKQRKGTGAEQRLELKFSKALTLEILREKNIRPPPTWSMEEL